MQAEIKGDEKLLIDLEWPNDHEVAVLGYLEDESSSIHFIYLQVTVI